MRIRFVSLISQNNRPLYIQAFLPQTSGDSKDEMNELLKYNFLSHMSLDVFESPFCPPAAHSVEGKPCLLFVQDGILVYGCESQTGLKIVIGCSRYEGEAVQAEETASGDSVSDSGASTAAAKTTSNSLGSLEGFAETDVMEASELVAVTNSIKKEYIRHTCNPFLEVKEETEIKSRKFDGSIKKIVEDFNLRHV